MIPIAGMDVLIHQNETCDATTVAPTGGINLWDVSDPTNPVNLAMHVGDNTGPDGEDQGFVNDSHSYDVWTNTFTGKTLRRADRQLRVRRRRHLGHQRPAQPGADQRHARPRRADRAGGAGHVDVGVLPRHGCPAVRRPLHHEPRLLGRRLRAARRDRPDQRHRHGARPTSPRWTRNGSPAGTRSNRRATPTSRRLTPNTGRLHARHRRGLQPVPGVRVDRRRPQRGHRVHRRPGQRHPAAHRGQHAAQRPRRRSSGWAATRSPPAPGARRHRPRRAGRVHVPGRSWTTSPRPATRPASCSTTCEPTASALVTMLAAGDIPFIFVNRAGRPADPQPDGRGRGRLHDGRHRQPARPRRRSTSRRCSTAGATCACSAPGSQRRHARHGDDQPDRHLRRARSPGRRLRRRVRRPQRPRGGDGPQPRLQASPTSPTTPPASGS